MENRLRAIRITSLQDPEHLGHRMHAQVATGHTKACISMRTGYCYHYRIEFESGSSNRPVQIVTTTTEQFFESGSSIGVHGVSISTGIDSWTDSQHGIMRVKHHVKLCI